MSEVVSLNALSKIFKLLKNKFYILSLQPINMVVSCTMPAPSVPNGHLVLVDLPKPIKNLYVCATPITYGLVPTIAGFNGNQVSVQVLRQSAWVTVKELNNQTMVSLNATPPYGQYINFRLTGLVEYE